MSMMRQIIERLQILSGFDIVAFFLSLRFLIVYVAKAPLLPPMRLFKQNSELFVEIFGGC